MQPDNAIIGDAQGIDLPQAVPDESAKLELASKAKYSKSKEYKDLRQKAEDRIGFYQKFLPNGQLVGTASKADMERKWELANLLIAEFQQLFSEHDNADALLKEEFSDPVFPSPDRLV